MTQIKYFKKHKFDNTNHVLKIKKTYDVLMKKLVNPKFDLMPKSSEIFGQMKNMDIKKQQEIFSSLFLNKLFDKTKNKKLPTAPFDEKPDIKKNIQHRSPKIFEIGWSGQATTKKSLKPKVEVASKYPVDIDSAFFDYTDITELNTLKSGKENRKKLKKTTHRRKKTSTRLSTIKVKHKKSLQLIKKIPKTSISKLYRLNAERREKAMPQSILELSPGVVNISDPPSKNNKTEETESKMNSIGTGITLSSNSDKRGQSIKNTVSNSIEITEFQEEKELNNFCTAENQEELSQTKHKKQNSIIENHQDYKSYNEIAIPKQSCSTTENIQIKKDFDEHNGSFTTKLNEKCAEDKKYYQKNLSNSSETSQVGFTKVILFNNDVSSKNVSTYDKINVIKGNYEEKRKRNKNDENSSVNDNKKENYEYLDSKNTTNSAVKTQTDFVKPIALSKKPKMIKQHVFLEGHLSFRPNKSMCPNPICKNSQINQRQEPIIENNNLSSAPVKKIEKDNSFKQPSNYFTKKTNFLSQQVKNTSSPVINEVVCNKLDTSNLKSSSRLRKLKRVMIGNLCKKHQIKNVDFAEDMCYNNDKEFTNFKGCFNTSNLQKINNNNSKPDLTKDLLNNDSLLSTKVSTLAKPVQKFHKKSREPFIKNNKSRLIVSAKANRQNKKLSKSNAKLNLKKAVDIKRISNRTHPFMNSQNGENEDLSKHKNNKRSATKHTKDSSNQIKVIDLKKLSSTNINKFEEVLNKQKIINSDYLKFVENKAWFSGGLTKSPITKSDNNVFSGNPEIAQKSILKFSRSNLTDMDAKNKENGITYGVSPENMNYKVLKVIQKNKEKLSSNLRKSTENRAFEVKKGIKYPKTNKNHEHLKVLKPVKHISHSKIEQDINKFDQNKIKPIRSSIIKQTANIDDDKLAHPVKDAKSNFARKRELIANKTKPIVQLSKSLNEVSTPAFSTDLMVSSNIGLQKVQNNLSIKGLKKTRKLHSKKLDPKYSDLKMYGEGKHTTPISDVHSLKSIQVVQKSCRNKTNGGLSPPSRIESSTRFARNKIYQTNDKIFPIAVLNRNLCSVQGAARSGIVESLCKRFSTKPAAKSMESDFVELKTTNDSFKSGGGETMVKTNFLFNVSDNIKTNVKRTVIKNVTYKNGKLLTESADTLKAKRGKYNFSEVLLNNCSKEGVPVPAKEKSSIQKNNHALKVLYKRNETKNKGCIVKNTQQDNKFDIKTSKHTSCAIKHGNYNTFSHIIHSPLQNEESNKTKCASLNNTNNIQLVELHNTTLPKQIMDNTPSAQMTDKMTEGEKLKSNNKERNFEINNKDFLVRKPHQIFQHKSNKIISLKNKHEENYEVQKKGHSLFDIREVLSDKPTSDKPVSLKRYFEQPKRITSLPNLKYSYLEPTDLSALKPLRWRSKSDRLNDFLFSTKLIEVRNERKRTLIKSSITESNKLNKLNAVALNVGLKSTEDYRKLPFTNTKNTICVQTSKSKENEKSNLKTFLKSGKNQLVDLRTQENTTTTVGEQISNKEKTKPNDKQQAVFLLNKQVSKSFFNRESSVEGEFKNLLNSGIIKKDFNTNKVEFIKRPVNIPILCENKTKTSQTVFNSSELKKITPIKINEAKSKNEEIIKNFVKSPWKNYDKRKSFETMSNKYTMAMQTVTKSIDKGSKNIFNNDQEKEKHEIKLTKETIKSQKTSNPKTVESVGGIDCSLMKTEKEEPKTLSRSFDFNLPFNILAQNLKNVKDKTTDKEVNEPAKEPKAKQHYDQLQLLKTAVMNKHKLTTDIMEKQEDSQHVIVQNPLKLKTLGSFMQTLKPIGSENKIKPVLNVSKITKQEKNISEKFNTHLVKNTLSETHKLCSPTPLLPFNLVNRKSRQIKLKSPTSKQEEGKNIKALVVTGNDKRTISKLPKRFPVSLLAKHFIKTEKRLISDGNKGDILNKLVKHKQPSTSKTVKSTKANPNITPKEMSLADENVKKPDIKKELNTITGSKLSLNFDKLIKSKGRDNCYLTEKTDNPKTKSEDKASVNEGKLLQVCKRSKNLVTSAKLGKNKPPESNKCLEKIVDYGYNKSRSSLLHKGLIKSLKMIKTTETSTVNHEEKNFKTKPLLVSNSNVQTKTHLESSSPKALEVYKSNVSMNCEDIGKMKSTIRSKNTFRVYTGNKTMRKRQLQDIERHRQLGKKSLPNKCEQNKQSKNQNKISEANVSKAPGNNFIYLAPVNPQSKGIYVVEIKPSKVNEVPIKCSPEMLKEPGVSLNKNNIQFNKIANSKTNELKNCKPR